MLDAKSGQIIDLDCSETNGEGGVNAQRNIHISWPDLVFDVANRIETQLMAYRTKRPSCFTPVLRLAFL